MEHIAEELRYIAAVLDALNERTFDTSFSGKVCFHWQGVLMGTLENTNGGWGYYPIASEIGGDSDDGTNLDTAKEST